MKRIFTFTLFFFVLFVAMVSAQDKATCAKIGNAPRDIALCAQGKAFNAKPSTKPEKTIRAAYYNNRETTREVSADSGVNVNRVLFVIGSIILAALLLACKVFFVSRIWLSLRNHNNDARTAQRKQAKDSKRQQRANLRRAKVNRRQVVVP